MYKLSKLAAQDFAAIFEYTLLNFGEKQAEKYLAQLEDIFNLLVASPKIGMECGEYIAGIRRHYHQNHAIYYFEQSQRVLIVRILHKKMEPTLHFN